MIIDAVREYLETCPEVSDRKININCLGTRPGSCTLDNVPTEASVKKYCDGEELKQAVFVFGVRDRYDENMASIGVSELLERLEAWIFTQNVQKNLPELSDRKTRAVAIEVTKGGHLYDASMANGRWQLEFRLLYRQKV